VYPRLSGPIIGLYRGYEMSPASTAISDRSGAPAMPYPSALPYPTADLLRQISKEIVVDWQMPSDLEHKN
jgi:hypothetical protein